jgi:hypothetical protein
VSVRREIALAHLAFLDSIAISRPVYRRSDLLNFRDDWVAVNRDLLLEWFGGAEGEEFDLFCHVQHELESNRHDAFKETYRGP